MAFNTNSGRQSFTATAAQVDFDFNFKIYQATDIQVYLTPVGQGPNDATDILTYGSEYIVSITGDTGGTVTLLSGATLNDTVVLIRNLPKTRTTSYVTNGDLKAETINIDQDYQTYLLIDGFDVRDRAVVLPDTEVTMSSVLPATVSNGVIKVKNDNTGFEYVAFGDLVTDVKYQVVENVDDLAGIDILTVTTVIVRNSDRGGIFTYNASLSAINNGGTIFDGWSRQYSGAVNVKWFGGKGDGVTDDTVYFQNAVDYAFSIGRELYSGNFTYLTTLSIINLHDVKHIGEGKIKRGSTIFYLSPKNNEANTLYVSTVALLANDALSSSEPTTPKQAAEILKNYGPTLDGTWNVEFAAGTYNQANTGFDVSFAGYKSKNRLIIKGQSVGGHPNVPTVIFDGTGGANYEHGVRCGGVGLRVQVEDIKFINFTSSNTRIGLVGENEVDFFTKNIHADNCDWCGIYAFNTVRARVYGGILNACRSGFIPNATEATIYGENLNPVIISNSTESGVYWSRGAQGHADYIQYDDNALGLLVAENARVDTIKNEFYRNTVGIRTMTGGVYGEGGTPNVFGTGADANTTNIEYKALSGDTTELKLSENYNRVAYDRATRAHSGVGATDIATIHTLPAYRLQGVGKSLRVKIWATLTTVTAGSTIGVKFGGMTLNITAPAAASNLSGILEFELHEIAGGYRAFGIWQQGLSQFRIGQTSSGFDNTVSNDIIVTATLADAGDSITIYRSNVEIIG